MSLAPHEPASPAWEIETFQAARRRLFGIAYRMLGSVADAEDVLQEAWMRWHGADKSEIREPEAFLTTVTTRLCINVLQSARVRRETYIGPWLPEPINTEADPMVGAERQEGIEFAVLILLEKLSPPERAAYVLREALDYPYEEIARVLGSTPAACRQLVSRARRHLTAERRRPATTEDHRRFLTAFLSAAQRGDTADLEALFASEITSLSDGNGVKLAARIPVIGVQRVAKFVAAFSGHFWTGKSLAWVELNGQPAVTLSENGVVTTALALTLSDTGITRLLWVMSPEKLSRVAV
ncbi:RNA polymerase sigma-70 factor [Microbacterium hibisci]|uniref:RNA polymerase sigma-70 factor n=1 Tax=Microbacterium hibisci TaxID=2036000 RepID=UPI001943AEFA|nr:RNA polymerase sigma-70 factor [Microbacterium hibisci]